MKIFHGERISTKAFHCLGGKKKSIVFNRLTGFQLMIIRSFIHAKEENVLVNCLDKVDPSLKELAR